MGSSTIALILAALKAAPILDQWFQELTIAYVKQKKANNDAKFSKALKDAHEYDVENLAASIGKHLDD